MPLRHASAITTARTQSSGRFLARRATVTVFPGEEKTVSGLKLRWRNGDKRSYKFEILTSPDGKNFTEVRKGRSEKSGGWETIGFAPVRTAFVRLVGHGSQVNAWTSLCEIKLLAPEK